MKASDARRVARLVGYFLVFSLALNLALGIALNYWNLAAWTVGVMALIVMLTYLNVARRLSEGL